MGVLLHGAVLQELIFGGGPTIRSYGPLFRARIGHWAMREICTVLERGV